MISTRHQWFAGAHLLDPYLTQLLGAFALTLTTLAFNQRRVRRFGTCPGKPVPRAYPHLLRSTALSVHSWRTMVFIAVSETLAKFKVFVPMGRLNVVSV